MTILLWLFLHLLCLHQNHNLMVLSHLQTLQLILLRNLLFSIPPAPSAPDEAPIHCTTRISCPPSEWWKVNHVDSEAVSPVIWSEDKNDGMIIMMVNRQTQLQHLNNIHSNKQCMITNLIIGDKPLYLSTTLLLKMTLGRLWIYLKMKKQLDLVEYSRWNTHNQNDSIEHFKARIATLNTLVLRSNVMSPRAWKWLRRTARKGTRCITSEF